MKSKCKWKWGDDLEVVVDYWLLQKIAWWRWGRTPQGLVFFFFFYSGWGSNGLVWPFVIYSVIYDEPHISLLFTTFFSRPKFRNCPHHYGLGESPSRFRRLTLGDLAGKNPALDAGIMFLLFD